jgi:serine phosphatase RsbU (regulator of sigma subunit)
MSSQASVTSTRSFQARLLHAERSRIVLMVSCLTVILMTVLVRRALGGAVTSNDAVYYPILIVILLAIGLLALAFADVTARIRRGITLPGWRLIAGAAIDLGAPFTALIVLHINSPRGAYAALSSPALLVVPIVIMLSVLRLRPWYSLTIGLAAAVLHWAISLDTILRGGLDRAEVPLVMSYGVMLAIAGAGAAALSHIMRQSISEAVAEAQSAERAAQSLRNIEHELDIARDIQKSLLPSEPPTMAGFDIAGMARPAAQTGGDYFDWQPLGDGRMLLVVADVTGHGIGPALVMAVCRAYARATAARSNGPDDFLDQLNALVWKDLTGGMFITMAVAIAHPDGNLELISAGHGPTFLVRRGGRDVEQYGGDGLPLGVLDSEKYHPVSHFRLEKGDALIMLTDGFMERQTAAGENFGIARLTRAIAQNASAKAAQMIEAIDRAVTEHADGHPQGDDMTAVVLKRT